MYFSQFSAYLQQLEATPSRLKMTAILAELFKQFDSAEIEAACYLMQGRLVPQYQSLEFNLSVKTMIKVLARLTAQEQQEVGRVYREKGDLGLVLVDLLARNNDLGAKKTTLLIQTVYQNLKKIAFDSGLGSQDRKLKDLVLLLSQLDVISAKFVVRIILGRLRLGFSTMTILDALSWSKRGDKSEAKMLEEAYQKKADIGKLAKEYLCLKKSASIKDFINTYAVELGVPIVPALCQRLNSTTEIIEKMGQVIVEPKYDGLRLQIHLKKFSSKDSQGVLIKAYTRNLEDATSMFPELKKVINDVDCSSCILDTEAVAVDQGTQKIMSYQETMTRRRKYEIERKSKEMPIKFFVFDLLFLNGRNLLTEPLSARKEMLASLFFDSQVLEKTQYLITQDPQQLKQYHHQQLKQGLEGAVMKKLNSVYRSGRKGWRWVKIKEEEGARGQLNDTLDLIVMGCYAGKGKRAIVGLGACLLGIYDQKTQQIKTISKLGSGLSDQQLLELKAYVQQYQTKKQPKQYQVPKDLIPDVWLEPALVVEVAADDVTKTPIHTAKFSLRFPRLIQFRPDRSWESSTLLSELEGLK